MPVAPPKHRPPGWKPPEQKRQIFDRQRADDPARKLYYTKEWRALRLVVLAEEPTCRCGCGGASTVVDHIEPHRGDRDLFFRRSNLRGMTKRCHDAKTSRHDSWNKNWS